MLTLNATGIGGHTEVTFEDETVLVKYHKTSPSERGMIETLIEKGQKLGLKLHQAKKGVVGAKLDDIVTVILDKKGEVALTGDKKMVEDLAVQAVEKEIKDGRLVMEAREDGSWKILHAGEFKKKGKKQAVASHSAPGGG